MTTLFGRLMREPLLHFLAAGALLYGAYALYAGDQDPRSLDERTIVADREALVTFLQFRASTFAPEEFEAQYDALSPEQRDALAEAYIREEAMVREAKALGLDSTDYVIRQRLAQKILFLVDGAEDAGAVPTDAELGSFYEANREDYARPPELTFTHVFVDDERGRPDGEAAARQLLARLNGDGAGFNDAPGYGDRFPFLQNYVGRGLDFVANQFGRDFAARLVDLAPGDEWQGPVRSGYGWHIVLLAGRKDGGVPPLEEIRDQLTSDLMAERLAARREVALGELLDQYRILRAYAE